VVWPSFWNISLPKNALLGGWWFFLFPKVRYGLVLQGNFDNCLWLSTMYNMIFHHHSSVVAWSSFQGIINYPKQGMKLKCQVVFRITPCQIIKPNKKLTQVSQWKPKASAKKNWQSIFQNRQTTMSMFTVPLLGETYILSSFIKLLVEDSLISMPMHVIQPRLRFLVEGSSQGVQQSRCPAVSSKPKRMVFH